MLNEHIKPLRVINKCDLFFMQCFYRPSFFRKNSGLVTVCIGKIMTVKKNEFSQLSLKLSLEVYDEPQP